MHQPRAVFIGYGPSFLLGITLMGSQGLVQLAPISNSILMFPLSLMISSATHDHCFHFFSFWAVATSQESTGRCFFVYVFGKLIHFWLKPNWLQTLRPSKANCWSFGPSLAASLEPLAHHRDVASLSLFYRYYFGRCSSELAQLVPLPFCWGRSTHYSDRLHDFPVTIPRCYKDVYVNSFFPCVARIWNYLPIECFPLTYNLNGFKSRINRHLLTVGFF